MVAESKIVKLAQPEEAIPPLSLRNELRSIRDRLISENKPLPGHTEHHPDVDVILGIMGERMYGMYQRFVMKTYAEVQIHQANLLSSRARWKEELQEITREEKIDGEGSRKNRLQKRYCVTLNGVTMLIWYWDMTFNDAVEQIKGHDLQIDGHTEHRDEWTGLAQARWPEEWENFQQAQQQAAAAAIVAERLLTAPVIRRRPTMPPPVIRSKPSLVIAGPPQWKPKT